MSSSSFNISDFILGFLFLSALYIIPVGLSFLLMKSIVHKSRHPSYTFKNFYLLCIPGLFYGFLESASSRQGLNFLLVVPLLALCGVAVAILLRRIPLQVFVTLGCILVLLLWYMVPMGTLKMM